MSGRLPPALREREFRLLFSAQTVSLLGDAVAPVALAFAVLDLTHSASALGFAVAARTAALIAFVLAGGVWADRIPQQRLMIWSDLLRFGSQGVLAGLLFLGDAQVWQIVLLQAINGGGSAFFRPAASALVPQTIGRDRLQQANALLHFSNSGAWMLGPVVAGALVATIGSSWAIAFDAATFAASGAFLLCLRLPDVVRPSRRSFFVELRAGWSEVSSRSWVWVSLSAFALFNIVWGPFWVLGPLIARRALGGASAWATIVAALGLGSLLGSIVAVRYRARRPLLAAHAVVMAGAPVFLLLAIPAPTLAVAALSLLLGFSLAIANTFWETTLQHRIPGSSLSRVSAYDWLASMALNPIGIAITGPIATQIGNRATLIAAAGIVLLVETGALTVGSIRNLGGDANQDTFEQHQLQAA